MSLRKCPDCGKDVSSAAPACPHCGRPNRKATFTIEFAAGLGLAAICAVTWALNSSSREAPPGEVIPPTPHETIFARPYRETELQLTAFIGYNRTLHLFRIENGDLFPWSDCQLSLNSPGISGYDLDVKTIKPGLTDAVLLQSADFSDTDGRRFDPSTAEVRTLDVDCDTPRGRLRYGGRFVVDLAAR